MSEVVKRADTTPAVVADYFEKYGQAASGRKFVGDLLKFGEDGIYVAGQENREIKRNTQMVAYMTSLRCGWVCWEDGHKADEVMGLVGEGFVPPKRSTLDRTDKSLWGEFDGGEPRDPWQFSNDIVLFDPKDKKFYTFATSSRGGLGALGELCKAYGQRLRQHPGEWPIVSLEAGSYLHRIRSRGRIWVPLLHDVGWVAAKDQPAIEGAEPQQIEQAPDLPGF